MDKFLQRVIDYIDDHISDKLTLDHIANFIGFSKYYLNRMFSVYTGYSLMEYIRRKKLEYGVDLLKTGMKVLDVAVELDYSSERSFARAMNNEFGHTPSYYREHQLKQRRKLVIYDLTLNVDEESFLDGIPNNKIKRNLIKKGVEEMKEYLSKVKYEVIDKMTVISGVCVGKEPEDAIIGVMKELGQFYNINVTREFGFDYPLESQEDPMDYRAYEYWLVVDKVELAKLPSPTTFDFKETKINIKKIPSYRYASLTIEDPFSAAFERIPAGWKFLVSWLREHDFKEADFVSFDEASCLEEVKEVDGKMTMDIYIPVGFK